VFVVSTRPFYLPTFYTAMERVGLTAFVKCGLPCTASTEPDQELGHYVSQYSTVGRRNVLPYDLLKVRILVTAFFLISGLFANIASYKRRLETLLSIP
jgi:hypothetical protein